MKETMAIREPAVAGMFYPADAEELRAQLRSFFAASRPRDLVPKALIAPHAGYLYSGPIAAEAYRTLMPLRRTIRRVILIGPSHRLAFRGIAASGAGAFRTPLGDVRVDADLTARALQSPATQILDAAHAQEHGIEVHLPFLQDRLDTFTFLPLVVGDATAKQVADVLDLTWTEDDTLVVISSDLSHYYDYETARRMDAATSRAIEALRPQDIAFEQACGRLPIQGLLLVAQKRKLRAVTLDLRNSGDTAGPRDQVVGYGAYALVA